MRHGRQAEGEEGTADPAASSRRPWALRLSEAQALLLRLMAAYTEDPAIDIVDRCRMLQCILHPVLHNASLRRPVTSDMTPTHRDAGAGNGCPDSMLCAEELAWRLVLGQSSATAPAAALAGEGVSWVDGKVGGSEEGEGRQRKQEGEALATADGFDRSRFLLFSLSHFVNHVAPGYEGLPDPILPAAAAELLDVEPDGRDGVAPGGEGASGAENRGERGAKMGQSEEALAVPHTGNPDPCLGDQFHGASQQVTEDDENSGRIAALNAWLDDE